MLVKAPKSIFMNFFKNFFKSVKPAFSRFPVLYVFSAAASVFATLRASSYELYRPVIGWTDIERNAMKSFDTVTMALLKAAFYSMVWSFFIGIVCKKKGLRFSLLGQGLSLLIFPLAYFLFKGESDYKLLAFLGTLSALIFLSIFLLLFEQKEELVVPNIIISFIIASIASVCVCAGLFLIRYAVSTLLIEFNYLASELANYAIIFSSVITCFFSIFTAYICKEKEEIVIPKFFKVIFLYILLPLYLVLLVVLYAYLAKSLFTLSLPQGQINWFVSFTSVFFLIFYFSLRQYSDRFPLFYCRWGGVLLVPLLITQCISFAIRINAYGYTAARYASLLYIIFSIVCIALSFVKKGQYMNVAFPLLATLFLLASITPLNIIDVPQRQQFSRIEGILKKTGLFADEKIDIEHTKEGLSNEDKAKIVDSYDAIKYSASKVKKPVWFADDFMATFGFAHLKDYDSKKGETHYFYFSLGESQENAFDVSSYSKLFAFILSDYNENTSSIIVKWGKNQSVDISKEVEALLVEKELDSDLDFYSKQDESSPLVLKEVDGWFVIFTSLHVKIRKDEEGKVLDKEVFGQGYVCR